MQSTLKVVVIALTLASSACRKKYTCNCTTTDKSTGEQTTGTWTRKYDTEQMAGKECGRNEEQFNNNLTVKCELH